MMNNNYHRHPTCQDVIRRFGHIARHVQHLPPPAPLSCSFSSAVERGMVNHGPNQSMKRRHEDWRQEEWMEEDDSSRKISSLNMISEGNCSEAQEIQERDLKGEGWRVMGIELWV
jgi:hypothetical protein